MAEVFLPPPVFSLHELQGSLLSADRFTPLDTLVILYPFIDGLPAYTMLFFQFPVGEAV